MKVRGRCVFGATLLALLISAPASAADSPFFQKVSPRGTWLAVDPQDQASPPTSVELSRFGVRAGDFLAFRSVGGFRAGHGFDDDAGGALAVFRRGGTLYSPGPDYSPGEYTTSPTCPNGVPTDVPQDFQLPDDIWIVAQVPKGAISIAFSSEDCFRDDNTDPNGDYGIEIATFDEVLRDSVTLKSTQTSVSALFQPNYDMPLPVAAHLGGYDRFNWVQAVTEIFARTGGIAGRMTKGRCSHDPVSRKLCHDIGNKNGTPPLPVRASQPVFFIDPIYGGFQFNVDDFGLPFPVRDSRPWYLDEIYGPRGERSGETELESRTSDDALSLAFSTGTGPGISFTALLSLAGVRSATKGDLLFMQGSTVTWDFPPPAGKQIQFTPVSSLPKSIIEEFAALGVSVQTVGPIARKR